MKEQFYFLKISFFFIIKFIKTIINTPNRFPGNKYKIINVKLIK